MSLFNAFGQGGFAALSQTLENIGNIVAPIAPAEGEAVLRRPEEDESDNEDDDRTTFDSKIQNFFSSMRDSLTTEEVSTEKEPEPGSPGSFVSVELSDDSPRSTESKGNRAKVFFDNRTTSSLQNFGVVSGLELDKKVHQKYREQLEGEIANLEHKYAELQRSTNKKIEFLEQERLQWKQLAEGTGTNNLSDATDREEEISTLYEKLGSLTNELESKEEELATAQETILAMNSESLSSNLSLVNTQTELQTQYETTRQELERLDEQNCQLADQLEEANEMIRNLQSENARSSNDTKQSEEQLIALTNQLRASNKTINALESKVSDLTSALAVVQGAAQSRGSDSQESTPMVDVPLSNATDGQFEARIQELQLQVDEMLQEKQAAHLLHVQSKERIDAMNTEMHSLTLQVESLSCDKENVRTALDAALGELQSAGSRLETAKQQNEALRNAFAQGQQAAESERESNMAVVAQLRAGYEQNIAAVAQRRLDAEKERSEVQSQFAALTAQVAEQQEHLRESAAEMETLRERSATSCARAQELEAQIALQISATDALRSELQACQQALADAQAEVAQFNEALQRRNQEISALKETMLTTASSDATSGESSPAPTAPSATSSAATDDALAAAQADFQKAVKKVKALNKQLKEKDSEAQKFKDEAAATSDELALAKQREAALHVQVEQLQNAVNSSLPQGESETANAQREHLLTELKAAALRIEELQTQHKAIVSELQLELQRCRETLQTTEERESALDAALSSSEETLKTTEETAWQCKAEASELLFALECEQTKLREALQAKTDLEAQLTQVHAERHRMPLRQRSESTDSILSLSEVEKVPRPDAGLPPVGQEDALSVVQANYNKAIRKIKAVNRQLKDKDVEIQKATLHAADLASTVESLQDTLAERTAEVTALRSELVVTDGSKLDTVRLEAELDKALDEVRLLQARVCELSTSAAATGSALQSARENEDRLGQELSHCQASLRGAEERVAALHANLTSSEETLKTTEETAWQCKAEASELLFALECEQTKLREALLAKDDLQDQLTQAQVELQAFVAVKQSVGQMQMADADRVREQLIAVHSSLIATANSLRFFDPQTVSPTISSSAGGHESTFEDLVSHCSTDILGPVSMLAVASKSLPVLSERIMSQWREQGAALSALREQENYARTTLNKMVDVLSTLKALLPGDTDGLVVQADDIVTLANRVAASLGNLVTPLQNLVESVSVNSTEVSRLADIVASSCLKSSAEHEQWSNEKLALSRQIDQSTAQIYSLQAELADTTAALENCQVKYAHEKQQLLAEMNSTQSSASQYTEQLQSLRLQVQKLETENKQLHQVIAQLRQVRKVNKGESDNAISERDELRNQCSALQSEVAALEQQLRHFTATSETVVQLQAELAQAHAALAATERNLETTRRAAAQLEKDCYDKDSELEVTRSDILLVRQELDRRLVEVSNLNEAIHQVETERAFTVTRLQKALAEKVEAARKIAESGQDQALSELRQLLEQERSRRIQLEEASQDHELFHRKAELDFNKEKKKMQRTLENALASLNNSQQQVIDRMLVANLIVSYFKRRRSVEVLKIIAKVLAFDDEQLIAVGLKVPNIDIFATILSTVIGKPAPPPELEGDNLAEQWISYLINESDQDASNSAGLVTRSRSNSSTHSGGAGSAPPSPMSQVKMHADFK